MVDRICGVISTWNRQKSKAVELVSGRGGSGVQVPCGQLGVQPTPCVGSPFSVGWSPVFISELRKLAWALSVDGLSKDQGPSTSPGDHLRQQELLSGVELIFSLCGPARVTLSLRVSVSFSSVK